MQSRAKIAGHPAHPMLIVFPLGLLVTAAVFDAIEVVTDDARFGDAAFRLALIGLIGAVLAWVAGIVDYLAIPAFTRARRIAAVHGIANTIMLVLFLIATVIRGAANDDHRANAAVLTLELVAVAISAYAGWLGGELVERLGIGVDPASRDVDAPRSLETTIDLSEDAPVDHARGVAADDVADANPERHERVGSVESRSKVAGHATHPMLVPFPLGLFTAAVIFDVLRMLTDDRRWEHAAFLAIGAGLVMGVVAMLPGLIDYRHVPRDSRARRIGLLHGLGNVVVTLLFAGSWLARRADDDRRAVALALVLSFAGAALSGLTAWLGGELHQRLGVGIDPGAYADAPSSVGTDAIDLRDAAEVDRTRSVPGG